MLGWWCLSPGNVTAHPYGQQTPPGRGNAVFTAPGPARTGALGVGEGEEQRGGHADGLFAAAAHAAVLHLAAEELPDDRVPRGPEAAGEEKEQWGERDPPGPHISGCTGAVWGQHPNSSSAEGTRSRWLLRSSGQGMKLGRDRGAAQGLNRAVGQFLLSHAALGADVGGKKGPSQGTEGTPGRQTPLLGLAAPCAGGLPAASPPIRLRPLLLLRLLVQLGEDETVPALDEPPQVHLPRGLVRVSQDQPQRRSLRDGAESPQKIASLGMGQERRVTEVK